MIIVNDYEYKITAVIWNQTLKILIFKTDDENCSFQMQEVNTRAEAEVYADGYKLTIR